MIHLVLSIIQTWDRWRLRRLARLHPGLDIHPQASTNFAVANIEMGPGARLRIGAGTLTERSPGRVRISVAAGAEISVDEGCWLHTVVEPIHLVAYEGARLHVGPRTFLNGCLLSAKSEVELGESALIGSGTRLYDADQHPVDDVTPERADPIRIGHDVWLASDVTVLRGVEIGPNTIVGARSVVTQSIPEHSLAVGAPARPVGRIGDRSKVRVL